MSDLSTYLFAFLVGGAFCAAAQLLIDRTMLTPARILVLYVSAGVLLGALGIYDRLIGLAGCGATLPLCGFGASIARGMKSAVAEYGALGIFKGGFTVKAGESITYRYRLIFRRREMTDEELSNRFVIYSLT